MKTVTFNGHECDIEKAKYRNNRNAIQLLLGIDLYAVASVNLPDEPLAEDEICIKDYSENEGMLDALVKAGVVSAPLRYAKTGFVKVPVCKLLI